MLRKATTILAVVAASAAGCAGANDTAGRAGEPAESPPGKQQLVDELARTSLEDALLRRDHFAPLCDGEGYPLPGNVNAKQGQGTAVPLFCGAMKDAGAESKPDAAPPPPPPACDRGALNADLANTLLDEAVKDRRFRCLCDEKGYPLVGNINAKGATASQLCAALREKNLL